MSDLRVWMRWQSVGAQQAAPLREALAARGATPINVLLRALSGVLLALAAAVHLAAGVATVFQPAEAMYGESIVYDHAARFLRGEPLYQSLDGPPYTIAIYTPLYYLLAAGLQIVAGPGFAPGRLLSFVAGIVLAALIGRLAARLIGRSWAGVWAAALFLAFGLGLPMAQQALWSSLYKEDVLGVAFAFGAVVTLAGGRTRRRIVVAALLAALAVLTKQSLIAAGLTGTVWLWQRDRRQAALFGSVWFGLVIGTLATTELTTRAFVANTVVANANPFNPVLLFANVCGLLTAQGGALGLVALYLLGRRYLAPRLVRDDSESLAVTYWAASLLPLVGLAKIGSNSNYWIECAAITAAIAPCALWRLMDGHPLRLYRYGVAVLGLLLAVQVVQLGAVARSAVPLASSSEPVLGSLIERVRSEPGEVLAAPLDVVVLADREIVLEPFVFSLLGEQGQWDASPLEQRIRRGEVRLAILNFRLDQEVSRTHGYPDWPLPVVEALRETMVLEGEQAGRFVYVLRSDLA